MIPPRVFQTVASREMWLGRFAEALVKLAERGSRIQGYPSRMVKAIHEAGERIRREKL